MVGAERGETIVGDPTLFLNTHPVELVTCGLLESLNKLRELHPNQDLVLEVHEAAVTDNEMMKTLRKRLTELNMKLAYDDFGAGETRLVQLANVGPDYVKFDMHMIRDIHLASPRQRQLLSTLVKMVREFGIASLAEGVENREEHTVCCDIGFDYGKAITMASRNCQNCCPPRRSYRRQTPSRTFSGLSRHEATRRALTSSAACDGSVERNGAPRPERTAAAARRTHGD
ncbi:MAG: hypothetical protein CMJ64_05590 [Planctomycetaceae bacterium]|nr:hypothetical protein [Planctomycetaceae bacterium]